MQIDKFSNDFNLTAYRKYTSFEDATQKSWFGVLIDF
jgi:hypothetical protein